jgi:hypothetical protein
MLGLRLYDVVFWTEQLVLRKREEVLGVVRRLRA